MLVVVLFLLALGGVLLVVAVLALRRQVRTVRLAMAPVTKLKGWIEGDAEKAPLASVPSLTGAILTIGGATRDPRFMLLLFVEPKSSLCDTVVDDAMELCRKNKVRLLLVGRGGDLDEYRELVRRKRLRQDDLVLSDALLEDFLIGPVPSAALLDTKGYLVARGTVQLREHLENLLSAVCQAPERDTDVKLIGQAG